MFRIMFVGGLIMMLLCLMISILFFVKNQVPQLIVDITGWNMGKRKKKSQKKQTETQSQMFFEVVDEMMVVHTSEGIDGGNHQLVRKGMISLIAGVLLLFACTGIANENEVLAKELEENPINTENTQYNEESTEHQDEDGLVTEHPDRTTCRIELCTESDMPASQSEMEVAYIADIVEDGNTYTAYRKVVKVDGNQTETVVKEETEIMLTVDEAGNLQHKETFYKDAEYQGEGRYIIFFYLTDNLNQRIEADPVSFTIDSTAPVISEIMYSDADGTISEKHHTIYSNKAITITFRVKDRLGEVDEEEVFVTACAPEDRQPETTGYPVHKEDKDTYSVRIPMDLGLSEWNGKVTIWAADTLGNETYVTSENVIYHTSKPYIHMSCETDCSVWTNQNVTFDTMVTDNIAGLQRIVYKVNNKVVKKVVFDELVYTYSEQITAVESADNALGYAVVVEAINNCGTRQIVKQQVYIDKDKPVVSLSGVDNGAHYNTNRMIRTDVQDVSYRNTKTDYYITRTLDGKTYTMPAKAFYSTKQEDVYHNKMQKQGLYQIYAVTTDAAGNVAKSNTLSFVIDKKEPELRVSGIEDGTVSGVPLTLRFECVESFYEHNNVHIEVERILDGKSTVIRIGELPGKKASFMEHLFSEDGTYKVTFSATDRAGNAAVPVSMMFTVDSTRPKIRIHGTENYQQWAEPVSMQYVIEESYFSGNKVWIRGTRTDDKGTVEPIASPVMRNTGKISSVTQTFSEDGIYDVVVEARDEAGNFASSEVHFTVDRTKPVINRVAQCNGKYYQTFQLADSMKELFQDLTVTSYQLLLNGIEYNGTDRIEEEGKYQLFVEVEDELGNKNSENIEFMIDHTAPTIIFTGVKDQETVKESGIVRLAVADTDDIITEVRVNDVNYGADAREIAYAEGGVYRIEVDCEDKAGNQATRSICFTYEEPSHSVIPLGIAGAVIGGTGILLLVGVCLIRRKKT